MYSLFSPNSDEPLYIQLYMYYRNLIINGTLKYGDKIPSVRKCASEFNVSKMTVESAYMQLTAEGYVFAKSQSGYYVSDIKRLNFSTHEQHQNIETESNIPEFDLSGSSVDNECFNFRLWQKYVKNALRCEERLLSYGEAQGEYDLREAISEYASKERGVVCVPSQIVIGAGVQSLIQLLCSLDTGKKTVIFSGTPFEQGRAVFEDRGYRIVNGKENYQEKTDVSFIYTSPSHSNRFSDVMNISERIDLLNFAREHNSIVIEDDFDSEFCYFSRPVSSLQGLDGGENVAYIGTFSKLLLPSIRISFLVLPEKLIERYAERGKVYNQTASKTEQIALARYITDMKLVTQIKKAKKHYENKAEYMKNEITKELSPLSIKISDSGFILYFELKTDLNKEEILKELDAKKMKIRALEQVEQNVVCFFVSSASVDFYKIQKSVILLKKTLKIQ